MLLAFVNNPPDFAVLQKPTIPQLAAGVRIIQAAEPEIKFSEEVKRFIAAALLDSGQYFAPPDELWFVQHYLSGVEYRCPLCGNKAQILEEHDGVCDYCGRNWYKKATGEPVEGRKQVVYSTKYNVGPCLALYRMLRDNRSWESFEWDDNNEVHVQVARALAASLYREEMDRRFAEQREELKL